MKVLVGLSYCRAHAADVIMKPFANDIAAEKMICNDATTSLRCLLLGMVMVGHGHNVGCVVAGAAK